MALSLADLATAQFASGAIGAAVPMVAGLFGPDQRSPSFNAAPVPNFEREIGSIRASLDPSARDRIYQLAGDRVSSNMARNMARSGFAGTSAGFSAQGNALAELNNRFVQGEIQNRMNAAQQIANMRNIASRVALANAQGQFGADKLGFQTGLAAQQGFLGGLGKTAGSLAGLAMMGGWGESDPKTGKPGKKKPEKMKSGSRYADDFSARNGIGGYTSPEEAAIIASDPALQRMFSPHNPVQVGAPAPTRNYVPNPPGVYPGDPTVGFRYRDREYR